MAARLPEFPPALATYADTLEGRAKEAYLEQLSSIVQNFDDLGEQLAWAPLGILAVAVGEVAVVRCHCDQAILASSHPLQHLLDCGHVTQCE